MATVFETYDSWLLRYRLQEVGTLDPEREQPEAELLQLEELEALLTLWLVGEMQAIYGYEQKTIDGVAVTEEDREALLDYLAEQAKEMLNVFAELAGLEARRMAL